MKKIFLLLGVIGAIGFSSLAVKKTLHRLPVALATPSTIITGDHSFWSASLTTAAGYKRATAPGDGQAVLTRAQFKEDGSFDFVFSKINTMEQLQSETTVEGRVEFTKTTNGKNCFVTNAVKAICRETKNGATNEYPVAAKELASAYSGHWLWEKISFKDIPSEDFLLMVDLKEHPAAAIAAPGSIDRSWVSKFYLRK